ncbi:COG1470 family protein [Candidatus Solincola sp.]|jgi:hypothetical protein|nr:hypothetical protein [Actinomycetota bacterium]MDI7253334.1 hypothetical protein [Actinomycetota bacterium]
MTGGGRRWISALAGNPLARTALVLSTALLFVLLPLGPREAQAQDFDLTVSPVKKELTVQPGERIDFQITLINHTERDLELLVYPMDFFINPDNSYEFHEPGYYSYSCSRWLEMRRDRLTIPPRSQHEEPFTLVVPPDAEPGGHYAVLFFQDASEPPPGLGVKPTYRIGSLILVTVPGDIVREAEIRSLSVESDFLSLWGPPEGGEAGWPARSMKYHLEVENTGNVHLTLQAYLTYRAGVGFGSGSVDLGEITILPGTVRYFDGFLPSPPCLGYFRVEAVIMYGPDMYTFDTEKRAGGSFWVVPLLWILFILLAAAGTWYLVRFLRGRFRVSLKVTRK